MGRMEAYRNIVIVSNLTSTSGRNEGEERKEKQRSCSFYPNFKDNQSKPTLKSLLPVS
jgi:hypothetical protein